MSKTDDCRQQASFTRSKQPGMHRYRLADDDFTVEFQCKYLFRRTRAQLALQCAACSQRDKNASYALFHRREWAPKALRRTALLENGLKCHLYRSTHRAFNVEYEES